MSNMVYERASITDQTSVSRPGARRLASLGITAKAIRHQKTLAIIDGRVLCREHLSWGILASGLGLQIRTFGSVDDLEQSEGGVFSVILVCIDDTNFMDSSMMLEIEELVAKNAGVPVIVQAELSGLQQVCAILERGARGYLPGNAGLSVCVQAISMALAGGIFVAAEHLVDLQRILGTREKQASYGDLFTPREEEVIEVLRQGKANKTIAYTLNVAPNTVKVHVRNILKKLRATNRAEAIYKINAMI